MFVTKPSMGVRGIFPLIKKHASECITVLRGVEELPRGTRLAIDATLWIQRLHFAGGDPHPDRHVFGFHRLIKQLRDHDLVPIMVFDNFGQQARLPAKSREHQRRRSLRCMLTLRAKIEEQRAKRLRVLQGIIEQYREVRMEDQGRISRLLSGWRDGDSAQQDQEGLMNLSHDDESAWDETLSPEEAHQSVLETYAALQDSLEEQDHELDNLFRSADQIEEEGSGKPIASNEAIERLLVMKNQTSSSNTTNKFHYVKGAWDDAMWSQVAEAEESNIVRLAARIRALRRQYALHVARANAGAAVSYGVAAEWPKETATQQKMTHSEGEVYRALEAGVAIPQISAAEPTKEEQEQAQREETIAAASEGLETRSEVGSLADEADVHSVDESSTGLEAESQAEALQSSALYNVAEEEIVAGSEAFDADSRDGSLADETAVLSSVIDESSANLKSQSQAEALSSSALHNVGEETEPQHQETARPTERINEPLTDTHMPAQAQISDPTALDDLETLTERNAHMQQYYVRSSATLTQSAFESCASLCEMLKVPVLWTGSGGKGQGRPHEAEAMASMLVRHGYADMVVSEDSDVLLYDAPLLRGVMGSKKLELVDSVGVRRKLFPPNEASKVLQHLRHLKKGDALTSDDPDSLYEELTVDLDSTDAEQSLLADIEKEEDGKGTVSSTVSTSDGERSTSQEELADRLSRRQMLDFALLCGTDFNRTIPGIAASRAFRLIQEFGSIDGIRAEALRRAALDKRKARREGLSSASSNSTARTSTKTKISTPPSDPAGSSLIPSLRNESGLRTPGVLNWREYGKELTQARHVFEHPPTLFWELRKVRDLKRGKDESIEAASLAAANVDQRAVRAFLRKRRSRQTEDDSLEVEQLGFGSGRSRLRPRKRYPSSSALETPVDGFGKSPYGDGGPIATWP